jgi:hypothetical protein
MIAAAGLLWLAGGLGAVVAGCGDLWPAAKQGAPPAPTSRPAEALLGGPVPAVNDQQMQPVTGAEPRPPGRYLLAVRMSFFRVEVPYGLASNSERLWGYLDEEIADGGAMSALHRNGFRVGRAKTADWEPVGKLLREMAGRAMDRTECLTTPGRAEAVPLQEHRDRQRMFIFTNQGRLVGRDYPPGDNVLMLTCHLNDEDPSELILQVAPLVRSDKKVTRWEKTETGYQVVETVEESPIEPLEFTVKMARGTFIVIGPGAGVARETSPGCCFLIGEKAGLRYETLMVIVPEVFASPI